MKICVVPWESDGNPTSTGLKLSEPLVHLHIRFLDPLKPGRRTNGDLDEGRGAGGEVLCRLTRRLIPPDNAVV